jgi:hypothetical protein
VWAIKPKAAGMGGCAGCWREQHRQDSVGCWREQHKWVLEETAQGYSRLREPGITASASLRSTGAGLCWMLEGAAQVEVKARGYFEAEPGN